MSEAFFGGPQGHGRGLLALAAVQGGALGLFQPLAGLGEQLRGILVGVGLHRAVHRLPGRRELQGSVLCQNRGGEHG